MEVRKSVRLLVVDEQQGYFEQVRDYAELCSHQFDIECAYARTEVEARIKMKSFLPTVIMIDAHLPDVGDLRCIQDYQQGFAPVIVTSDHRSIEIEEAARENGAHAYVTKSDQPEELELLLFKISVIAGEIAEIH